MERTHPTKRAPLTPEEEAVIWKEPVERATTPEGKELEGIARARYFQLFFLYLVKKIMRQGGDVSYLYVNLDNNKKTPAETFRLFTGRSFTAAKPHIEPEPEHEPPPPPKRKPTKETQDDMNPLIVLIVAFLSAAMRE